MPRPVRQASHLTVDERAGRRSFIAHLREAGRPPEDFQARRERDGAHAQRPPVLDIDIYKPG